MPAFGHCLINMAATAALVSPVRFEAFRANLGTPAVTSRGPLGRTQFPSARNFSDLLGSCLP